MILKVKIPNNSIYSTFGKGFKYYNSDDWWVVEPIDAGTTILMAESFEFLTSRINEDIIRAYVKKVKEKELYPVYSEAVTIDRLYRAVNSSKECVFFDEGYLMEGNKTVEVFR